MYQSKKDNDLELDSPYILARSSTKDKRIPLVAPVRVGVWYPCYLPVHPIATESPNLTDGVGPVFIDPCVTMCNLTTVNPLHKNIKPGFCRQ